MTEFTHPHSKLSQKTSEVSRTQHPSSVMLVWLGVSRMGKTKVNFVNQCLKFHANNYIQNILKPIFESLTTTMFNEEDWTLQQDSVPGYKAKISQQWLKKKIPDSTSARKWPTTFLI